MSKFLVSTCEVYRVETESEVKRAIEEAKQDSSFALTKYVSEYKERKLKGEVVDSYYKLTLTKTFNDIKEPTSTIEVVYNVSQGAFPDPIENSEEKEW